MNYSMPGSAFGSRVEPPHAEAPLVLLFERDDALAVPLLSQLRLAGYDVRAARTPVELFDAAQKHTVELIVVDLGNAAASRREFWVALDAQRRGRAIQVLTFRVVTPGGPLETDLEAGSQALADLEVGGPHEMAPLVAAVRQRVPLGAGSANPLARGKAAAPGMAGTPGVRLSDAARPGMAPSSPFAHPASANPFAAADAPSPFDQPDTSNPFAQTQPPAPANPFAGPPAHPYAAPFDAPPYTPPYTPPPPTPFMPPGADGAGPFAMPLPVVPVPPGDFAPAPGQFAPPAMPPGAPGNTNGNGYAAPWRGPSTPPGPTSYSSDALRTSSSALAPAPGPAPVMDAWLPPDGAALPTNPRAPALPPDSGSQPWAGRKAADPREAERASALPAGGGHEASWSAGSAAYAGDSEVGARSAGEWDVSAGEWSQAERSQAERSTAPVPAWVPAPAPEPPRDAYPLAAIEGASGGLTLPEERALSTVLVEGALLSPQQLAVLKDIRRILNGVDVEYKLGELALLFHFLSPDQLLAALLVSRQLISPEQIAALGRIKQEMAASGMNYDLETLLVMFHILSRDDLDRLRAELA